MLFGGGGEGFRHLIADDTWVKALEREAHKHTNVVISDLRFLNEAEMLKANDAVIIRIAAPDRHKNDLVSQHRSEMEMDGIEPTYTIANDSSIEDLHQKVLHIVVRHCTKD